MTFNTKDLAPVGEEQQVIMGISHYQQSYCVLFPGYHADDTFATTMLWLISMGWHPFNKPPSTERYHYSLVRDEVFFKKIYRFSPGYLSAPWVAIFRF